MGRWLIAMSRWLTWVTPWVHRLEPVARVDRTRAYLVRTSARVLEPLARVDRPRGCLTSNHREPDSSPVIPLVQVAKSLRSEVQIAGLQLDFSNPQNAEDFEFWVPFDEEIAVGWT